MKIAAVSDIHGYLPKIGTLKDVDVFFIVGDICPIYNHNPEFQIDWCMDEFNSWLKEVPAKQIIGVGGNHDFAFQMCPKLPNTLSWTYLFNSQICVKDGDNSYKVWGSPNITNLTNWAFYLNDGNFEKLYSGLDPDIDIMLTHNPPYSICDRTLNSEHVGIRALTDYILNHDPILNVCGHIHEGRGMQYIGNTTVLNVSYLDRTYNYCYEPVYLELKNREITIL